jgi:hypothetical protein
MMLRHGHQDTHPTLPRDLSRTMHNHDLNLPTDRLVSDRTTASPFHHPPPRARISQGLGARPMAGSRVGLFDNLNIPIHRDAQHREDGCF